MRLRQWTRVERFTRARRLDLRLQTRSKDGRRHRTRDFRFGKRARKVSGRKTPNRDRAVAHQAEPDAPEYGLGSRETHSDAHDPGHVAIDHTNDGAVSGLRPRQHPGWPISAAPGRAGPTGIRLGIRRHPAHGLPTGAGGRVARADHLRTRVLAYLAGL